MIESFSVVFRKIDFESFTYSLRFVDEAGNVGPETWGEEHFLPEEIPIEATVDLSLAGAPRAEPRGETSPSR